MRSAVGTGFTFEIIFPLLCRAVVSAVSPRKGRLASFVFAMKLAL